MSNHLQNIRLPLRTSEDEVIHPSLSKGNAYSQDTRQAAVQCYENGDVDSSVVSSLRSQHSFPSHRSVVRWVDRLNDLGNFRPFRRSGNKRAEREIIGNVFVLLALYRVSLPKATQAEVSAFLAVMNGYDPMYVPYSPSQITRAEDLLNLTRKRGSTTAFQAYDPFNLQWRDNYWNMPYPYGMSNIKARDIIDIDEAGLELVSSNRRHGKSHKGERVREAGPYSKTGKVNLLLAISGDPDNPDRWHEIWSCSGTTISKFVAIIRRIISDIGPGTVSRRRCFTFDNLSAHLHPQVMAVIYQAGHRVVPRAPYWPVDGAIEYVFNTLQVLLCVNLREIKDNDDLINHIQNIFANFERFIEYFRHVGFIL